MVGAVETSMGYAPKAGESYVSGLKIGEAEMVELWRIDVEGWKSEVYLNTTESRLPARMKAQLPGLRQRLGL